MISVSADYDACSSKRIQRQLRSFEGEPTAATADKVKSLLELGARDMHWKLEVESKILRCDERPALARRQKFNRCYAAVSGQLPRVHFRVAVSGQLLPHVTSSGGSLSRSCYVAVSGQLPRVGRE